MDVIEADIDTEGGASEKKTRSGSQPHDEFNNNNNNNHNHINNQFREEGIGMLDESSHVWGSDHLGVVADLQLSVRLDI